MFLMAAAAAAVPLPALAGEKDWNSASGNWSIPSLWLQNAIPAAGDDAFIVESDAINRVILYDYTGPAITLNTLRLDNTGSATNQLTQMANVLTTNAEYVGYSGNGAYMQNGGTNSVLGGFVMGQNFGSQGSYTLGAGATLSVGTEYVGGNGNGAFTQNGGSHTVSGFLFVAFGTTGTNASSGSFTLSNGVLSAGSEQVGRQGSGTFTQSGGSNTTSTLYVGSFDGAHFAPGTYTLSGSAAMISVTNALIGHQGPGTFNQSGGTAIIQILTLGYGTNVGAAPASGSFALSNGATLIANAEYVGYNGNGVFNESGGSHSASTLYLGTFANGTNAASSGVFNLSNGASLTVSSLEIIGNFGMGIFTHTGGSNTTAGLTIAQNGGSGTYTLSGGLLTVTGNEAVGFNGSGSFTQLGGTHNIGNDLNVAARTSGSVATGTFNLSGGTLTGLSQEIGGQGNGVFNQTGGSNSATNGPLNNTLGTWASLVVGDGAGGSGTYNQSGGSNSVTNTSTGTWGNMVIGNAAGSIGTYNLSNSASLTVGSFEYVANAGNGTFNQTGGRNTAAGLVLGNVGNGTNPASSGVYNMSGGVLSVSSYEQVGRYGNGTFNQSGGSNTTPTLYLGDFDFIASKGSGIYNLSNGASVTVNNEFVGYEGPGTFNQSGGTHSVTSFLYLGWNPAGSGTYALSAGMLNVLSEEIGVSGTGVLQQSGGIHAIGGPLELGFLAAGSGTVTLSGGTLTSSAAQYIGYSGNGVFNHSGGSNSMFALVLGQNAGSSGTYTLSGTGILNAATGEYVGGFGNGVFIQNAGTHTVGQILYVGYGANGTSPASIGVFSLTGGSLSTPLEYVGYNGIGTFNQSGGSHTATSLVVAANLGSAGTFILSGGALAASVTNNGSFIQTGGSLAGNFTNNGSFNYGGGGFTGSFTQTSSSFTATANFIVPGGILVTGTLPIPFGGTVTANGPGLDLEGGNLALSGGTLAGSGALLNNGLISGFGTLAGTGGMTSNASISVAGGNLAFAVAGTNVNNGNIALASGRQLQLNSALLNNGAILLNGGLLTGTGSLNNAAGSLVGPGTVSAPLVNTGSIVSQNGALNLSLPMMSNSGILQLNGPGASLAGGTLANFNSLQGAGAVANAVINNGTIEPLGGTLDFTGALTNSAAGVIRAASGNKVLVTLGLSSNAGLITLAGGVFDNNGHALTNAGQIDGYGIVASGGLINNAGKMITFGGGPMTVNGPVTNSAGATLRASYAPVLFTGPVVNNGTIKTTGTTATFASGFSGAGLYFSDPSDNYFQSDVTILSGGQVLGATGDRFFISGTYSNAGTYSNNGGSLAGQNVVNDGSFNQSAGQATILALSGTGSTTVGGGAGTALVSVSSLSQGSVTINSGGTLTIRPAGSRLTNAATNLQLNGTGTLDLNNHELLTNTSPNTIKGYLTSAYDPNGNADWGQPGLTSSLARGNPTKYSIAYAFGGDQSAIDAGVTTHGGAPLGASQTLVRPVLTGDDNMDGTVNFFDISQILGYKYNTGQAASYTDGDLDYNGKVDFFDISLLLSANYNTGQTFGPAAPAAAPSLSGSHHTASTARAVAASTTIGVPGDGKPDFEYDPATGHLRFRTDGGAFTTTGGTSSFVSSLTISSAGGILIAGGASPVFATGTGATLTSTLLSSALTNSPGFSDNFDIGIVLAPGLDAATLTGDLTVKYQSLNGGSLRTADVTFIPEPASLAFIALGLPSLVPGRRRRRRALPHR
jgi:hypothetical protein